MFSVITGGKYTMGSLLLGSVFQKTNLGSFDSALSLHIQWVAILEAGTGGIAEEMSSHVTHALWAAL